MKSAMLPVKPGTFKKFYIANILFIRARGKESDVYKTNGERVVLNCVLHKIERELNSKDFFNINTGCLINMQHISEYKLTGKLQIKLTDQTVIHVPDYKRKEFQKMMQKKFPHL